MKKERIVKYIGEAFFNDGHWYTLTSASLGGMSPEEFSNSLCESPEERILELMENAVCLPLAFDCDCALDQYTQFVIGDLSEKEESEWIARIQAPLNLPDGKMVLVAGAMPEQFEAIESGLSDDYVALDIEPGQYTVEVYAYVGSFTVNEHFYQKEDDDVDSSAEAPSTKKLHAWWAKTYGDSPLPEWLKYWEKEGYVDNDECNLLAYIIRLVKGTQNVSIPPQDKDFGGWVTEFKSREPDKCPRGIKLHAN